MPVMDVQAVDCPLGPVIYVQGLTAPAPINSPDLRPLVVSGGSGQGSSGWESPATTPFYIDNFNGRRAFITRHFGSSTITSQTLWQLSSRFAEQPFENWNYYSLEYLEADFYVEMPDPSFWPLMGMSTFGVSDTLNPPMIFTWGLDALTGNEIGLCIGRATSGGTITFWIDDAVGFTNSSPGGQRVPPVDTGVAVPLNTWLNVRVDYTRDASYNALSAQLVVKSGGTTIINRALSKADVVGPDLTSVNIVTGYIKPLVVKDLTSGAGMLRVGFSRFQGKDDYFGPLAGVGVLKIKVAGSDEDGLPDKWVRVGRRLS